MCEERHFLRSAFADRARGDLSAEAGARSVRWRAPQAAVRINASYGCFCDAQARHVMELVGRNASRNRLA